MLEICIEHDARTLFMRIRRGYSVCKTKKDFYPMWVFGGRRATPTRNLGSSHEANTTCSALSINLSNHSISLPAPRDQDRRLHHSTWFVAGLLPHIGTLIASSLHVEYPLQVDIRRALYSRRPSGVDGIGMPSRPTHVIGWKVECERPPRAKAVR